MQTSWANWHKAFPNAKKSPITEIPIDCRNDVTYDCIVVDYRPQKNEPNCTRLTVGGNIIDFPGDVSTLTADLTTAKLVINSTISTPGDRYMCGDVKNFYLCTPTARYGYSSH